MLGRRALATLGLVALTVVTTQAAGPVKDNDHLAAVWVAESKGVLKLAASDGRTLCELPDRHGADSVAVDERGAVLWTYGDDHLRAYSFACALLSDTRVDLHDRNALLAVHQGDGSVWIGAQRRLLHVDALGKVNKQLNLRDELRALAVDAPRARVWYAGEHTIIQLSEEGALVKKTRLPSHSEVHGMALDPTTGALWIATEQAVERLDTPALSVPFHHAERLSADNAGGLWIASDRSLQHVTADGRVTASFEPFGFRWLSGGRIDAMQADLADSSVWVAGHHALAQYDTAGNLLRRFDDERPADPRRHHHHHEFGDQIRALALYSDRVPPDLTVTSPAPGAYVNTARPEFKLAYGDDGIGVDTSTLKASLDGGAELPLTCEFGGTGAKCQPSSSVAEGKVTITFVIKDYAGNASEEVTHSFTVDTTSPTVTITSPEEGAYTNQVATTLAGKVSEAADVTIDGEAVFLSPSNGFSRQVGLTEGANQFSVKAVDKAGNSGTATVTVNLDTVPPARPDLGRLTYTVNEDGTITIAGSAGSVEAGAWVQLRNKRTGEVITVKANSDGSFLARIGGQAGDALEILAADLARNESNTVDLSTGPSLPPDPATIAPPIAKTGITPMYDAASFLFTGSSPIQTGVKDGTIEAGRIAVLRGLVRDAAGSPVSGVEITIKDHPEFGQTLTRADGAFDMAVNGGGYVTVQYSKKEYFPVQRQLLTPWTDWIWLPDVVMTQADAKVTTISLTSGVGVQVAEGSARTDRDGTRQAVVLFPEGLEASLVMPDGTTQALTSMAVRATEYTVGDSGLHAMPGPLPPMSGYTYAVELSVDEAIAAGAKEVSFSAPVPVYVDNFLNFPAGEVVPAGWYDRAKAAWIPAANGRVIKVLSVTDGLANLAVAKSGQVATATELAALGISDAERQTVALRFGVGRTFWRVPVTHFTPWDFNWPNGPPDGAKFPKAPTPKPKDPDDCDEECGSVIETQTQILGESVPIAGSPLALVYRSNRVPGRKDGAQIEMQLSDSAISDAVKRIELDVEIGGVRFQQSFDPSPNGRVTFAWNGMDALGRELVGRHTARVTSRFVYPAVYYSARDGFAQSFALAGAGNIIGDRDRSEIKLEQRTEVLLDSGRFQVSDHLGSWTLSNHHSLSVVDGMLLRGDGSRERANPLPQMDTVHAWGSQYSPTGVHADADGSVVYGVAGTSPWVTRQMPDGRDVTVAGTSWSGFSGDGGPATRANIQVTDVAVGPDGSVYILGGYRIRKVGLDGIIQTIAGNGNSGDAGDGGPALQAQLSGSYLTVAPDGSIYIIASQRLRKIGTDGIINTVAGGSNTGFAGDGGPMSAAKFNYPQGIAIARDGTIFVADSNNNRIRRIGADGIITTIAGTGRGGYSGDGGKALEADIEKPMRIAVSPLGELCFSTSYRIRCVSPDGTINAIAGTGVSGTSGDKGLARLAQISGVRGMSFGPKGDIYFADSSSRSLRKISWTKYPVSSAYVVPSSAGGEYYEFDSVGRHLRTIDAVSGALRYAFEYDSRGYLVRVTDGHQNTLAIERDSAGVPTAIIAPHGQRTTVELDGGYLKSVGNPMGETYRMGYKEGGLLTSFSRPAGNTSVFEYDDMGRLTQDKGAAGSSVTVARTEWADGYEVSTTSAEGVVTRYAQQLTATGEEIATKTTGDGRRTVTRVNAAGGTETSLPDGTVVRRETGPDPRFGMQVPVPTTATVTTPSGRVLSVNTARTATFSDRKNMLSWTALSETRTVNGQRWTSAYDRSTGTVQLTTPMGRIASLQLDMTGNVIKTQWGGLSPYTIGYDSAGQLTDISLAGPEEVLRRSFGYDAGNLSSVTDWIDGEPHTATFEYDLGGLITKQTFPDNRYVLYTYDQNGNLASLTPPGRAAHVFQYTPADLEESYTPPALDGVDTITRYTYNKDKRLTRIDRPDGQAVGIDYEERSGRKLAMNFSRGQIGYRYYPTTGRLQSITAPDQSLSYSWDGFLPLSETATGEISGIVSRTYDNNFLMRTISVNGEAVSYEYDNDGLITKAGDMSITRNPETGFITDTVLGAVTTHRGYTSRGDLKSEVATVNGAPAFSTEYVRDAIGRVTEKTETIEGVTTVYGYHYDAVGRLDEVKTNSTVTARYRYDENGNRLSKWTPDGEETGTYDAQDRMVTYGGASYEYTPNGELRSKTENGATTHYTYDELGNLVQVKSQGDVIIDYVIDGRNRRVGKKVNGQLVQGFLYQGESEPVAELDGDGNVVARFIYGSKRHVPDLMLKNGKLYRIVSDHLGSPRSVIDTATGEVVQRIEYDEFGNIVSDTSRAFQPFGFAGGLYEQHTRLTRFGARDYEAYRGVWTSKDPILFGGGDSNLYAYVFDDPINWIDPVGLENYSTGEPEASNIDAGLPGEVGVHIDLPCVVHCPAGDVDIGPLENDFYTWDGAGEMEERIQEWIKREKQRLEDIKEGNFCP
jgi:RHS repeat-associated protein